MTKMMDLMLEGSLKMQLCMSITSLMENIEQLNGEMVNLGRREVSIRSKLSHIAYGSISWAKGHETKTSGEEDSDYIVGILNK